MCKIGVISYLKGRRGSYQNRQKVIWTDLPGHYLSQFGAADGELDDDTEIGDAFEIGLIFDDRRQEGQRLK